MTDSLVDKQRTSRVKVTTDNEMAWWIRSMLIANGVGKTAPLKAVSLVHKQHINDRLCGV